MSRIRYEEELRIKTYCQMVFGTDRIPEMSLAVADGHNVQDA